MQDLTLRLHREDLRIVVIQLIHNALQLSLQKHSARIRARAQHCSSNTIRDTALEAPAFNGHIAVLHATSGTTRGHPFDGPFQGRVRDHLRSNDMMLLGGKMHILSPHLAVITDASFVELQPQNDLP